MKLAAELLGVQGLLQAAVALVDPFAVGAAMRGSEAPLGAGERALAAAAALFPSLLGVAALYGLMPRRRAPPLVALLLSFFAYDLSMQLYLHWLPYYFNCCDDTALLRRSALLIDAPKILPGRGRNPVPDVQSTLLWILSLVTFGALAGEAASMPSNSNAAMVALGSAFVFALLPLGIVEVNSHGMMDRVSEALDKDSGVVIAAACTLSLGILVAILILMPSEKEIKGGKGVSWPGLRSRSAS